MAGETAMSEIELDACVEVENYGSIVVKSGGRLSAKATDNDDVLRKGKSLNLLPGYAISP